MLVHLYHNVGQVQSQRSKFIVAMTHNNNDCGQFFWCRTMIHCWGGVYHHLAMA